MPTAYRPPWKHAQRICEKRLSWIASSQEFGVRVILQRRLSVIFVIPHSYFPIFVNLDANDVRSATNRTVLNVLLARSSRQIDRDDDLFAAGVTDVACLILYLLSLLRS